MPYVSCNIMPRDDPFAARPSAGERFAQRRTVPRYSLAWPVEIFEPIDRTRFAAATTEVSVKGCCISSAVPLDRNTIVRLQIQWRQETVEVWARVTGSPADGRTGLAFLGTAHHAFIEEWISAERRM
jgi:hypothetical protein